MRRVALCTMSLALLLMGAAPAPVEEDAPQVATIRTNRGSFRAVIRDAEMIERARRELAGGEDAGVPIGRLAWGDGGVNVGHRWHVVELGFADFTVEVCDGTVRAVDREPEYWVETVGFFCPWSGQVVRLRPLRR